MCCVATVQTNEKRHTFLEYFDSKWCQPFTLSLLKSETTSQHGKLRVSFPHYFCPPKNLHLNLFLPALESATKKSLHSTMVQNMLSFFRKTARRRSKKSAKSTKSLKDCQQTSPGSVFRQVERQADDANVQVVQRFIDYHNNHDSDGIFQCCNPLGLVKFEGAEMPMTVFQKEIDKILRAFPDSTFLAESGIECTTNSSQTMGLVKICKLVVRGTHTGEPFGFGPYEPLPATGIRFELDPEFVIFTVVDGIIEEIKVTRSSGRFS